MSDKHGDRSFAENLIEKVQEICLVTEKALGTNNTEATDILEKLKPQLFKLFV
jgi:hypothetical protein